MANTTINVQALEPLYEPWEAPNRHRVRAERDDQPARIVNGRRPSPIIIAQNLRHFVAEWRDTDYPGASETSRELLNYWFGRSHTLRARGGEAIPFRYYYCQREAIETLIYLLEVRAVRTLSALTEAFGGPDAETAAIGVHPEDDAWPRYAFKVATGAGKTKIMSLAIVWSYFHALRESDSPLARHFVLIAPNLTVFERLKEDFGNGAIFDRDPLIPSHWRGDWNLSVVLQDEASGAATGGVLYLTNIHRLYEARPGRKQEAEMYDWLGPAVSRARALDTGAALRERILSHPRVLVLNDEAHHVWDPDSAWNEAIAGLHRALQERRGQGLAAQLDFSATPKDNKGNIFQHVVCDTPLGEAVDAGIVKTPIVGRAGKMVESPSDDAAYRYQEHLLLGYSRWLDSKQEWERSGKKALLFVMCEDTAAADQITRRLNSDPLFSELNGYTLNLHTNLKGKVRKRGKGEAAYYEFAESEADISDEDLRQLRQLSRELDDNTSPYRCIVSVLMLREGWDVRNVTTIVPLRPYSAKANILPEQTLGRGLRRMTAPGSAGAAEIVAVVEHPAFVSLYREELSQQGLPLEVVDVDKVPRSTVSIYPDAEHKDLAALEILIPQLSQAHHVRPELAGLTLAEVKQAFAKYKPLPLGAQRDAEVEYTGRHLFTNEIVEQMKIKLPLLQSGFGAIAFYREELERICQLRGTHARLAPLIESFLTEILFGEKVSLTDQRLITRLADADVREHIRAVFVPLIRSKTICQEERVQAEAPKAVTAWRPFQVTHSEHHPAIVAERTPFNLVPCNRQLEVAFANLADRAGDVAAFCKNAGPQCLRIDYLAGGGRLSFYTPDFLVRSTAGRYYLVETKGREDLDVPAKARAAMAWCQAASEQGTPWEYVYLPERVFLSYGGNTMQGLAQACAPALAELLHEAASQQLALPFYEITAEQKVERVEEFIAAATVAQLPSRYRRSIEEATALFKFLEGKGASLAPAFTPLLGPLDEAAKGMIAGLLAPAVPPEPAKQQAFFAPSYAGLSERDRLWYLQAAANLKKLLVYNSGVMPLGLLAFCLEHAREAADSPQGVFAAIRQRFAPWKGSQLAARLDHIKEFRNTYIAHQEHELTDVELARTELRNWISGLAAIYRAHHTTA